MKADIHFIVLQEIEGLIDLEVQKVVCKAEYSSVSYEKHVQLPIIIIIKEHL